MTIALKVGVFTQFIQGYVINIGIKLFQRQFLDPNRIVIQNFIAKIKAARGLKSAQDTTLVISIGFSNRCFYTIDESILLNNSKLKICR